MSAAPKAPCPLAVMDSHVAQLCVESPEDQQHLDAMTEARAKVAELIERDKAATAVYECILRACNDLGVTGTRYAQDWIRSWAAALHEAGFAPTNPEAPDIRAALAAFSEGST